MCVAKRHSDETGALLVDLLLVESLPPRYFVRRGGSQGGVMVETEVHCCVASIS